MMPLLWSWTSKTYSIADKKDIAGMNVWTVPATVIQKISI
jgi:hypothetical protein